MRMRAASAGQWFGQVGIGIGTEWIGWIGMRLSRGKEEGGGGVHWSGGCLSSVCDHDCGRCCGTCGARFPECRTDAERRLSVT
jgi:hypothetical protein